MSRITNKLKDQIAALPKKELENILLHLIAKDKDIFDFVIINYINKEKEEIKAFEDASTEIENLFLNANKSTFNIHKVKIALIESLNCIDKFAKNNQNNKLEADLCIAALDHFFSYENPLSAFMFFGYDKNITAILNRLIEIVHKRLEDEHKKVYKSKIDKYLDLLKSQMPR